MSATGVAEQVLRSHSESMLGNELFPHVEKIGSPELTMHDLDVGYAEYHDEDVQDIVIFNAELYFSDVDDEPEWREGRLIVEVSGQARRNGDDWDIGSLDIDHVRAN